MALIKCYECSKEISDTVKACPHCGAKNIHKVNLFKNKRKIMRKIGIIIASIILISFVKLLVHYFIFTSSVGTFHNPGDYHTRLKNPNFVEYNTCSHPSSGTQTYRIRNQNQTYSVSPDRLSAFQQEFGEDNIQLVCFYDGCYRKTGEPNLKNDCPYIYLYYGSFAKHAETIINPEHILDGGTGNWRLGEIPDILEGRYVTSSWINDIDTGFKSQSQLYFFIIPIYILLYWLIYKYYFRKEYNNFKSKNKKDTSIKKLSNMGIFDIFKPSKLSIVMKEMRKKGLYTQAMLMKSGEKNGYYLGAPGGKMSDSYMQTEIDLLKSQKVDAVDAITSKGRFIEAKKICKKHNLLKGAGFMDNYIKVYKLYIQQCFPELDEF